MRPQLVVIFKLKKPLKNTVIFGFNELECSKISYKNFITPLFHVDTDEKKSPDKYLIY